MAGGARPAGQGAQSQALLGLSAGRLRERLPQWSTGLARATAAWMICGWVQGWVKLMAQKHGVGGENANN